jgi:ParB family transcriptional regulator, chromosome partitioning protein
MEEDREREVQLIPVSAIRVPNPRARNRKVFRQLVESISQIGLKKPITVTRKGTTYALVCGEGRLEAYRALGQKEIPAFVIEADVENGMLKSLVENVARRQHRALDLLHDIGGMKRRGYEPEEVAVKTGLTVEYVRTVIRLSESGETRLLAAVESGQLPISVAINIVDSSDRNAQSVLQEAYESKLLRGKKLLAAKRLIEQRNRRGKEIESHATHKRQLSVETLVRTYRENTDKKRLLVKKAEVTRDRLVFVIEALRKLLTDENFQTLLRAEGFDTLPQGLSDRLGRTGTV